MIVSIIDFNEISFIVPIHSRGMKNIPKSLFSKIDKNSILIRK